MESESELREQWKIVWNYQNYEVSNFGRVRRKENKRIRKLDKTEDGYYRVALQKNKPIGVHRLVFEAFYRRLLPNEQAHHINLKRDCNLSTNLVAKNKSIHLHEHKIGKPLSQQTKEKMSESHKGYKQSEEHIANRVKALVGRPSGMLGKKHSQQTKRKQSEALKGRVFSQQHKQKLKQAWIRRKMNNEH